MESALKKAGLAVDEIRRESYEDRKKFYNEGGLVLDILRHKEMYDFMGVKREDKSMMAHMEFHRKLAERYLRIAEVQDHKHMADSIASASRSFALGGDFYSAIECMEAAQQIFSDLYKRGDKEQNYYASRIKECNFALDNLSEAIRGDAVYALFVENFGKAEKHKWFGEEVRA